MAVTTTLDSKDRQALGIPAIGQLHGTIDVAGHLTGQPDGSMDVDLEADLLETTLEVPQLGWSKPPNEPGKLSVAAKIGTDWAVDVHDFELSAPDLRATGNLLTTPGLTGLKLLELKKLKWAENSLAAHLKAMTGDGWEIDIRGPRVDVGPSLSHLLTNDDKPREQKKSAATNLPPLVIAVRIDEVVDGPKRRLGRLDANARHGAALWEAVSIDLEVAPGNVFGVRVESPAKGGQNFEVTAANAGEVLSALMPTSDVTGGALLITARSEASDAPITGHFRLENYVVTQSENLTRLLQLASIGGALDALQGNGLDFSRLESDFSFVNRTLGIEGFVTHGSSIGITADGTVDFTTRVIDLKGAVVPMSRVQKALGKLPILGVVLTGTKKEGMFAVNYGLHGSFSKPDISVNPLSGLTPGILRDMFRIPKGDKAVGQ